MTERKEPNITIYTPDDRELCTIAIESGSQRVCKLMESDYVELHFTLTEAVVFPIGAYYDDELFGRFYVTEKQLAEYTTNTNAYAYKLKMEAFYRIWNLKAVALTAYNITRELRQRKELEWNLTANLKEQMREFMLNLQVLGEVDEDYDFITGDDDLIRFVDIDEDKVTKCTQSLLITYSSTYMIDALKLLADTWECEYWVTGKRGDFKIHFGKCYTESNDDEQTISLESNATDIKPKNNLDKYGDKLYYFGGLDNIPNTYRKNIQGYATSVVVDDETGLVTRFKIAQNEDGSDVIPLNESNLPSLSDIKEGNGEYINIHYMGVNSGSYNKTFVTKGGASGELSDGGFADDDPIIAALMEKYPNDYTATNNVYTLISKVRIKLYFEFVKTGDANTNYYEYEYETTASFPATDSDAFERVAAFYTEGKAKTAVRLRYYAERIVEVYDSTTKSFQPLVTEKAPLKFLQWRYLLDEMGITWGTLSEYVPSSSTATNITNTTLPIYESFGFTTKDYTDIKFMANREHNYRWDRMSSKTPYDTTDSYYADITKEKFYKLFPSDTTSVEILDESKYDTWDGGNDDSELFVLRDLSGHEINVSEFNTKVYTDSNGNEYTPTYSTGASVSGNVYEREAPLLFGYIELLDSNGDKVSEVGDYSIDSYYYLTSKALGRWCNMTLVAGIYQSTDYKMRITIRSSIAMGLAEWKAYIMAYGCGMTIADDGTIVYDDTFPMTLNDDGDALVCEYEQIVMAGRTGSDINGDSNEGTKLLYILICGTKNAYTYDYYKAVNESTVTIAEDYSVTFSASTSTGNIARLAIDGSVSEDGEDFSEYENLVELSTQGTNISTSVLKTLTAKIAKLNDRRLEFKTSTRKVVIRMQLTPLVDMDEIASVDCDITYTIGLVAGNKRLQDIESVTDEILTATVSTQGITPVNVGGVYYWDVTFELESAIFSVRYAERPAYAKNGIRIMTITKANYTCYDADGAQIKQTTNTEVSVAMAYHNSYPLYIYVQGHGYMLLEAYMDGSDIMIKEDQSVDSSMFSNGTLCYIVSDYDYNVPYKYFVNVFDDPSSVKTLGERRLMLPIYDEDNFERFGKPYGMTYDEDTGIIYNEDKTLQYIDGYIMAKGATEGVATKELVETDDDIYPDGKMIVQSIVATDEKYLEEVNGESQRVEWAWTQYHIKVRRPKSSDSVAFSAKYVLDSETLGVRFLVPEDMKDYADDNGKIDDYTTMAQMQQQCRLSGMSFEAEFHKSRKYTGKLYYQDGTDVSTSNISNIAQGNTFTIIRNTDYGAKLPNTSLLPQVGDPVVLTGWNVRVMPALHLVAEAEYKLLAKAFEYFEALQEGNFSFECTMRYDYCVDMANKNTYTLPDLGQKVCVQHKGLKNAKHTRIIGFTAKLDKPYDGLQITCGETEQYSRLKQLERMIRNSSTSSTTNRTSSSSSSNSSTNTTLS